MNKTQIKQHILDAYNFRHACKAYDPTKKISDDDMQLILETGRLSPSSFGFEPWKFLLIENKEIASSLVKTLGAWVERPTTPAI